MDFLKLKICFADIINYGQRNGPSAPQFEITFTVYAVNMWLTIWKKKKKKKKKKNKEKKKILPGNNL